MKITQEKLQVNWAETLSIVRFQERLNAENEDSEYEALASLLHKEFEKFKPTPPVRRPIINSLQI